MGVNSIREIFKESDYFRFHLIINQGGTLVNCVPDAAYIKTAQALVMTIVDLLYDDAVGAKDVLENFTPALNKQSYIELLDRIAKGE